MPGFIDPHVHPSLPAVLTQFPFITPDAVKQVEEWTEGNIHRVMYDGHFKIMMDGAIYSGAPQYGFPGYLEDHRCQWMAPLDITYMLK